MTRANDRYEVEVIGTPDPPNSQYMVLNLVHDFEARVAVAKLANNYERSGQPARAAVCRQALTGTLEAHKEAMQALNAWRKDAEKKGAAKKDRRA